MICGTRYVLSLNNQAELAGLSFAAQRHSVFALTALRTVWPGPLSDELRPPAVLRATAAPDSLYDWDTKTEFGVLVDRLIRKLPRLLKALRP